jgi:hypothetical protein
MVPRMIPKGLVFGVCAVLLSGLLSGCGVGSRADAAKGVEEFLRAAQAHDPLGFEARIDRPALRADLRRQLMALGQQSTLEIEGGPSERALDRMIGPEAFQLVEANSGQALPAAPTTAQLALLLKPIGGGKVCLHDAKGDDCLLTFAKIGGRWRLTAMRADNPQIGGGSEPAAQDSSVQEPAAKEQVD